MILERLYRRPKLTLYVCGGETQYLYLLRPYHFCGKLPVVYVLCRRQKSFEEGDE